MTYAVTKLPWPVWLNIATVESLIAVFSRLHSYIYIHASKRISFTLGAKDMFCIKAHERKSWFSSMKYRLRIGLLRCNSFMLFYIELFIPRVFGCRWIPMRVSHLGGQSKWSFGLLFECFLWAPGGQLSHVVHHSGWLKRPVNARVA